MVFVAPGEKKIQECCWLYNRETAVRFSTEVTRVSLLQNDQTGCETHPAHCAMQQGIQFTLGLKRLDRKADDSPPSSAEADNDWSCRSTPPIPYALMALQRDKFKMQMVLMSLMYSSFKIKTFCTPHKPLFWYKTSISYRKGKQIFLL